MRHLSHRKQRGLSLVELMVAVTLGGIITAGLAQLFSGTSATYNLMEGQSRMQESGRFALDFMARSIQRAGYKGCFSKNEDVDSTMDENIIPYEYDIRNGMEAYNNTGTGWLPNPVGVLDASITDVALDEADIITIRFLSNLEHRLAEDLTGTADPIVITPGVGETDLTAGEYALIHDCEKATIFQVTTVNDDVPPAGSAPAAGSTKATIEHEQGISTSDPPGNDRLKLPEYGGFETDAAVNAINTQTFYIAPGAGVNNEGNAPLSLWRKVNDDAPVEIVEGVEDLQALYGLDDDEDDVPDSYVGANLITDYSDVITVRIVLTVNSVDAVGGSSTPTHGCAIQQCYDVPAGDPEENTDGLVRKTFSQTMQVRNKG